MGRTGASHGRGAEPAGLACARPWVGTELGTPHLKWQSHQCLFPDLPVKPLDTLFYELIIAANSGSPVKSHPSFSEVWPMSSPFF